MKTVVLYTTAGCHLCDEAKELSSPFLECYGYEWQDVEISDSDELIATYGVRIPVLARPDNNSELGWPFEPQHLRDFLTA